MATIPYPYAQFLCERGPESAETVIRIIAGHTLNYLGQLETIVAVA